VRGLSGDAQKAIWAANELIALLLLYRSATVNRSLTP
jgi:hypothetical protein